VKLYLGMMAASVYNCTYLLNILEAQFVINGGDISWVTEGLEAVDSRVRKFSEINETLAYQPWKLTLKQVEELQ